MWIVGAVFAAVGLPFLWLARRVFARDAATAAWPRAAGTILSARIESWTQRRRDEQGYDHDHTVYKPVIRYTYDVAGRALDGSRIARSVDDVALDRQVAERYLARYPERRAVEVLYDPSDPSQAYLEVNRSMGALILSVFGCVFVAIGALLLVLWATT